MSECACDIDVVALSIIRIPNVEYTCPCNQTASTLTHLGNSWYVPHYCHLPRIPSIRLTVKQAVYEAEHSEKTAKPGKPAIDEDDMLADVERTERANRGRRYRIADAELTGNVVAHVLMASVLDSGEGLQFRTFRIGSVIQLSILFGARSCYEAEHLQLNNVS